MRHEQPIDINQWFDSNWIAWEGELLNRKKHFFSHKSNVILSLQCLLNSGWVTPQVVMEDVNDNHSAGTVFIQEDPALEY